MSTPHPETNTSSAPEPKQKQIAEPVYVHAVSWTWIVIGLICIFLLGGGLGAAWYIQTRNMAKMMLASIETMVKESDSLMEEAGRTDSLVEKGELVTRSLKLRTDAANMLDRYRRANPDAPIEAVLEELYNILESLYKDYDGASTAPGVQRGEQMSQVLSELVRLVSSTEKQITYQARLLELEWDRRNLAGIIERGKELFDISQRAGLPPNYDARRYIALALFEHLPVQTYSPNEHRLPVSASAFPEAMDDLLGRLNLEKPGDIEVAKRYAEFIASIDHDDLDRRRFFRACASEQLLAKSAAERLAEAVKVIDTMVTHNRDNPDAYLARYHFTDRFVPSGGRIDQDDPDLVTVLQIAPNNAEGLILSSIHAIRQAGIVAREEPERAAEWHAKAEEYLVRTVRHNVGEPLGYQYLGDFFLFVKNRPKEAVDVWNEGLSHSGNRGDEELIGRLVMVLLEQRLVDEVREKLAHLQRTIDGMRLTRPGDVRRTSDMLILLSAKLSNTEAMIAASKIDAAQRENRPEEVSRLFGVVQQKRGEATQKFEEVLRHWGRSENDYVFLGERRSVYSILLPESLMQLGDLKMDWGEWDSAASYFARAARIDSPAIQRAALLKLSIAYQQGGQLDRATQALKALSDASPGDLNLRYAYTTLLFRSRVASNSLDMTTLDNIERELEILNSRRGELLQPWAIDIRRIHLGVARANLSSSADIIVAAINEATRQFRVLERGTFPPDAEGNVRNYIDDPAFVAELVGIYSSLSATDDFRRLLEKLRTFPEGEDAYYEARINDCLRRDDREGAVAIIDEASTNTQLTAARRERFAALLQTLKGSDAESESVFERAQNQLQTTFDKAPESLKPQAFFILANTSLDKGNLEQAKQIRDRLEKIEGKNGRNWQYIHVRIMLTEQDPDFIQMRRIQEEIAGGNPDWDMAHLLRALIEEQYLLANPGDPATLTALITAYRAATRAGNTQTVVWQRLVELLENTGNSEGAKDVTRQATLRGLMLDTRTGQLPQPYGQMYSQVQAAIADENPSRADEIAQECIKLAIVRNARPELIFTLNLTLGKVFLDSQMFESATRHLTETARRGGAYIYPLAVCLAKSGDVDAGFTLLLDEIDFVPSALPTLLPAVLVLMSQVQPTEEVYTRIDRLMERVERGERLVLTSELGESEEDHLVALGTRRVPSRVIQSLVVRFPDKTENFDPSMIQFLFPVQEAVEETEEQPAQPAEQPAP